MNDLDLNKKLLNLMESTMMEKAKRDKNKNGIPDLVAFPKNCNVLFSEIKKPTGKVSKLQEYRLKELESYGFKTEIYKG